jgi:hypothetical protein
MLCELCNSVGRNPVGERKRASGEIFALSCDACGMDLDGTIGDRVGQTLAQLARFGLTGQKLLSRRRA